MSCSLGYDSQMQGLETQGDPLRRVRGLRRRGGCQVRPVPDARWQSGGLAHHQRDLSGSNPELIEIKIKWKTQLIGPLLTGNSGVNNRYTVK